MMRIVRAIADRCNDDSDNRIVGAVGFIDDRMTATNYQPIATTATSPTLSAQTQRPVPLFR
jgi:hypothetical protein